MRGRRFVRGRRGPNRNVQIVQILTLLVLLIIVLTFRTKVSDSAGKFLAVFAPDSDLAVEQPNEISQPDAGSSDLVSTPQDDLSDSGQ